MLNDEKLIKKINDYDKDFESANDQVYACIEGGLNKSKTGIIMVILFVSIVVIQIVTDNSITVGALIGGIIGAFAVLANDFCVIVANDKYLNLYIFNKFGTKIIKKIELLYDEIEIKGIKKTSIWNTIKIKTREKNLKVIISEKTIGLKNQKENSKKLTELLDNKIKKEM